MLKIYFASFLLLILSINGLLCQVKIDFVFDGDASPNTYRSSQNPYYWKNNMPYQGYWQQDSHYSIEASLDTIAQQIKGKVLVTYWNNSSDTLQHLFLSNNPNKNESYTINKCTSIKRNQKSNIPIEHIDKNTKLQTKVNPNDFALIEVEYLSPVSKNNDVYFFNNICPRMIPYSYNNGWEINYENLSNVNFPYATFDVSLLTPLKLKLVGNENKVIFPDIITKGIIRYSKWSIHMENKKNHSFILSKTASSKKEKRKNIKVKHLKANFKTKDIKFKDDLNKCTKLLTKQFGITPASTFILNNDQMNRLSKKDFIYKIYHEYLSNVYTISKKDEFSLLHNLCVYLTNITLSEQNTTPLLSVNKINIFGLKTNLQASKNLQNINIFTELELKIGREKTLILISDFYKKWRFARPNLYEFESYLNRNYSGVNIMEN